MVVIQASLVNRFAFLHRRQSGLQLQEILYVLHNASCICLRFVLGENGPKRLFFHVLMLVHIFLIVWLLTAGCTSPWLRVRSLSRKYLERGFAGRMEWYNAIWDRVIWSWHLSNLSSLHTSLTWVSLSLRTIDLKQEFWQFCNICTCFFARLGPHAPSPYCRWLFTKPSYTSSLLLTQLLFLILYNAWMARVLGSSRVKFHECQTNKIEEQCCQVRVNT